MPRHVQRTRQLPPPVGRGRVAQNRLAAQIKVTVAGGRTVSTGAQLAPGHPAKRAAH